MSAWLMPTPSQTSRTRQTHRQYCGGAGGYRGTRDPPEERASELGGRDVVQHGVDGGVDVHEDAEGVQQVEVHFLGEAEGALAECMNVAPAYIYRKVNTLPTDTHIPPSSSIAG